MRTNKSRLARLRFLASYAYYRMIIRPGKAAMSRHFRLVQALDQEEAAAKAAVIFNVVLAPSHDQYTCPECGEGDGRDLTSDNFTEVCSLCKKMRDGVGYAFSA